MRLSDYESVDLAPIRALAEEQSVVGLIAAGIEHMVDNKAGEKRCPSIYRTGPSIGTAEHCNELFHWRSS